MVKQQDCFFCEIQKKENSQNFRIICALDDFFLLLTSRPVTNGHVLLVSKTHYESLFDMPERERICFFETAVLCVKRLTEILGTEAFILKLNERVFTLRRDSSHLSHLHLHIIPRYSFRDKVFRRPRLALPRDLRKMRKILGAFTDGRPAGSFKNDKLRREKILKE